MSNPLKGYSIVMRIDIVTPFPELIRGVFEESMLKRAQKSKLAQVVVHDLRDATNDKHRTVDDSPYGGGAGMILKPEPIFRMVESIVSECPETQPRIIYLTPQGRVFNQQHARELSVESHLIMLCGHYRGMDERVVENLVTDEISIGDYILTGGELAAAVVTDAVIRLIPGVLGNAESGEGDSFSNNNLLDYPHYTRPEVFRGLPVPDVLLSGHHGQVAKWRKEESIRRTQERRPDLLKQDNNKNKNK